MSPSSTEASYKQTPGCNPDPQLRGKGLQGWLVHSSVHHTSLSSFNFMAASASQRLGSDPVCWSFSWPCVVGGCSDLTGVGTTEASFRGFLDSGFPSFGKLSLVFASSLSWRNISCKASICSVVAGIVSCESPGDKRSLLSGEG